MENTIVNKLISKSENVVTVAEIMSVIEHNIEMYNSEYENIEKMLKELFLKNNKI